MRRASYFVLAAFSGAAFVAPGFTPAHAQNAAEVRPGENIGTGLNAFNQSAFFTLGAIPVEAEFLSRLNQPREFLNTANLMLRAAETSPETVTTPRFMAKLAVLNSVLNPDGVPRMGLSSIDANFGGTVARQLRQSAEKARESFGRGGDPTALGRLSATVSSINDIAFKTTKQDPEQYLLAKLFIGRLAGKSELRDAPASMPGSIQSFHSVAAGSRYLDLGPSNPLARLQPARAKAETSPTVSVRSIAETLSVLRARSAADPLLAATIKQAADSHPDWNEALAGKTFFLRKSGDPELLRLLNRLDMSGTEEGVRILSDTDQRLAVLIVAIPERGSVDNASLVRILEREVPTLVRTPDSRVTPQTPDAISRPVPGARTSAESRRTSRPASEIRSFGTHQTSNIRSFGTSRTYASRMFGTHRIAVPGIGELWRYRAKHPRATAQDLFLLTVAGVSGRISMGLASPLPSLPLERLFIPSEAAVPAVD